MWRLPISARAFRLGEAHVSHHVQRTSSREAFSTCNYPPVNLLMRVRVGEDEGAREREPQQLAGEPFAESRRGRRATLHPSSGKACPPSPPRISSLASLVVHFPQSDGLLRTCHRCAPPPTPCFLSTAPSSRILCFCLRLPLSCMLPLRRGFHMLYRPHRRLARSSEEVSKNFRITLHRVVVSGRVLHCMHCTEGAGAPLVLVTPMPRLSAFPFSPTLYPSATGATHRPLTRLLLTRAV